MATTLIDWARRKASGRLASAAAWNAIALLLARGLPIIGMIFAARILGREEFGSLGILHNTVMMLQVFAVASLGTIATNYVARWRDSEPERAGSIITLCYMFSLVSGLIFAVGLILAADWVAEVVLDLPDMTFELRLCGLVLLFVTIAAVQTGVLMGFEAYRAIAFATLFSGVASVAGLAGGAYLAGVSGALVGLGGSFLLQSILFVWMIAGSKASRGVPTVWHVSNSEIRLLWTFGLPGFLTLVLWTFPTWGANVVLVRQPDGLAEMGLLAAALQWFSAMMFVPRVLTQVLLPIYASRMAERVEGKKDRLVLDTAHGIMICAVPIAVILVLASPWIAALYGPDFVPHASVFATMFIAAAVAAPQGALTNFLVARELMWSRFAINLLWAVILIVLALTLIEWGAFGIAIANLVAYLVRTVLTYALVRRVH
jgi:O-antigen/teichoic acid export membrane protein